MSICPLLFTTVTVYDPFERPSFFLLLLLFPDFKVTPTLKDSKFFHDIPDLTVCSGSRPCAVVVMVTTVNKKMSASSVHLKQASERHAASTAIYWPRVCMVFYTVSEMIPVNNSGIYTSAGPVVRL